MKQLNFSTIHTIAIIGLSDKPERPSFQVAKYLQSNGFRIIPVNPMITSVLGEKAYPDLASIPKNIHIDVIDIFRRSEEVMPHVQEALKRGDAQIIWMQEGVVSEEAKKISERRGKTVVMDQCIMKTHRHTQEHYQPSI